MPKRNGHGIDLLADPTRRRIVSLLALGVFRPAKIAGELELSRPAVSRQLRILLDARLISRRRYFLDQRGWMYYIDPRKLGQITAWLAGTEVGRAFPTYQDRERWIRAIVPRERNELDSDSPGEKRR
ncbi:MAG: metalloregulator ArsR/SmtB family transcription factor [Chloroflexota bacterium]|nr:metalloregulator ArsR/SmtB family transcription factor [Chloroflexota bacterium]